MNNEIETLVMYTDPKYSSISSRLIKEIAKNKGPLSGFVPENVKLKLIEKY